MCVVLRLSVLSHYKTSVELVTYSRISDQNSPLQAVGHYLHKPIAVTSGCPAIRCDVTIGDTVEDATPFTSERERAATCARVNCTRYTCKRSGGENSLYTKLNFNTSHARCEWCWSRRPLLGVAIAPQPVRILSGNWMSNRILTAICVHDWANEQRD